ncbi:peptide chain release factor N(5)-glutamine methyltransferase [Mycoplasmopsis arginini]|uniref:peptide chain release factor N(5)-glutamine methyltransferase n=1 Tax=Mycoplasmopsis arginini TaxID=2094 RepID=UPI00227C0A75|nr:peptide chain release factor N(5)-glutamine methyltransferase [Mycoplasmopsis arginini]MCY2902877.1 peptide chain release factor N(5)-glutamine methyltransferase [Mycoplasmopsis arginini QMP CG1-2758]MDI3350261.1 peptide chain release factor N(5)-glutamine methyltransferase [Mycoplasmopsis arginini]MDI3350896.1 peptide chain release factor N(5)-glutamine methyltransferase [Mycoplasmopsis arginini]MDI3351381.1 peptide chain release factor N(5)-glutamine methyltransferase [Mycoplasmopsis argin
MIDKEVLLTEKRRYEQPLFISKREEKLLKKDYPVQKIIGYQTMQNVHIDIRYDVLIPRYETEEVIIEAYKYINKDSKVLDLCCGSGFIGLAINKNIKCNVTLSDISNQAIKQTKLNIKINKLENCKVIKSNLFKKIKEKFDLIVSNPPYLNKNNIFANSLKWEPKKALFAKDSGLFFYKKITNDSIYYLKPNGHLILEIDEFSKKWLEENYPNTTFIKDINKKNRIAILKYNDLKK